MSLPKKMERTRRESVAATVLAVSQWLDEHSKTQVPVAAQALREAAAELRRHVFDKAKAA